VEEARRWRKLTCEKAKTKKVEWQRKVVVSTSDCRPKCAAASDPDPDCEALSCNTKAASVLIIAGESDASQREARVCSAVGFLSLASALRRADLGAN